MTSRESQLENRLQGCERLLELYWQELERLRALVERTTQANAQAQPAKAVTT